MAVSDTPPSLEAALSGPLQRGPAVQDAAGELRLGALQEDALAYGVRSGLARRSWEIQQMLRRQAPELDRVFDFNALLMERNVLPPVLTEARAVVTNEGTTTIRVTDRVYTIVQQARFVTTAPSWRNYLLAEATFTYTAPDAYLRPRSEAETAAWRMSVQQGWSAGTAQADQILEQALARLKRDFHGMVLYRTLLSQGMVSKPYVAEARYGITGDGNQVNINDRMLRITALPQLQREAAWRPIAVPATPVSPATSSTEGR